MSQLNTHTHGQIVQLEMCVPDKKNALTDRLRSELRDSLHCLQNNAEVSAIVLSGAGGAFCSGGDISAMTSDRARARARMEILHNVVDMLVTGTKPTVAAVSGPAFGAGFSLAMCCDQVVGDTTSTFCASFGRVGLPPDLGLTWTLPRRIGGGNARQILLTSRAVEADEAYGLGILDKIVPRENLLAEAIDTARELSAHTQLAKHHVKALMTGGSLKSTLACEMESYLELLESTEHMAFRDKFLNKTGNN
ncbi:MAG: enoyl-CoA hydratase/isomerase family protein [Parvibaculaceae bacterium]